MRINKQESLSDDSLSVQPSTSKWIKRPQAKPSLKPSLVPNIDVLEKQKNKDVDISMENLERDHAKVLKLLDSMGEDEYSEADNLSVSNLLDATITEFIPETLGFSAIPAHSDSFDSKSEELSTGQLENILNSQNLDGMNLETPKNIDYFNSDSSENVFHSTNGSINDLQSNFKSQNDELLSGMENIKTFGDISQILSTDPMHNPSIFDHTTSGSGFNPESVESISEVSSHLTNKETQSKNIGGFIIEDTMIKKKSELRYDELSVEQKNSRSSDRTSDINLSELLNDFDEMNIQNNALHVKFTESDALVKDTTPSLPDKILEDSREKKIQKESLIDFSFAKSESIDLVEDMRPKAESSFGLESDSAPVRNRYMKSQSFENLPMVTPYQSSGSKIETNNDNSLDIEPPITHEIQPDLSFLSVKEPSINEFMNSEKNIDSKGDSSFSHYENSSAFLVVDYESKVDLEPTQSINFDKVKSQKSKPPKKITTSSSKSESTTPKKISSIPILKSRTSSPFNSRSFGINSRPASAKGSVSSVVETNKDMSEEIQKLRNTIESLQRETDILQQECTKLTNENKELIHQHNVVSPNTLAQKKDAEELESLIKGYQKENEKLIMQVKELKLGSEVKKKLEETEKKNAALSREIEKIKLEHRNQISKLEHQLQIASGSNKKRAISVKDGDSFQKSLNEKQIIIEDLTSTLNELNQILVKKDSEISELQSEVKRYSQHSKSKDNSHIHSIIPEDIDKIISENFELKDRLKNASTLRPEMDHITLDPIINIHGRSLTVSQVSEMMSSLQRELDNSRNNFVRSVEDNKRLMEVKDAEHQKIIEKLQVDALQTKDIAQKSKIDMSSILQHNMELGKLLQEQDKHLQETRHEHVEQKSKLMKWISELELVITEYEMSIDMLKKKVHQQSFMKEERAYNDEISDLKTKLSISETHLSKLKNQLEVSEATRKAIHENTILILRQAQEESAKIALHQHERALGILRAQTTSQSTQLFDMEISRMMQHLKAAESDNGKLRQRITELESSMSKLKQNIPDADTIQDLKHELEEAMYERQKLEQELSDLKENMSPQQQTHSNLLRKLQALEQRNAQRNFQTAPSSITKLEQKYSALLDKKNQEILFFKHEMDDLISSLSELQEFR